ncbi:cell division protein FtsQ/DivIB [Roseateles saccharophilus]|uniref:Cell division protein FtsQ n=1 Tax=Roseateles saccharophilus TaxID=304 RepID=A0A4R3VEL9_ROSSA|nr:cell division protein FtsQ/DivIB [Roseateles saccharophilus]MDG0833016.1 FtsQ-type POTRA domain-containing protein [Roseateles saccharophilus]TCV02108.1 cell division protein FtsQ [Roseateles saccharophilus]
MTALPPDVRLMNAVSALLFAALLATAAWGLVRWAVRLPVFNIRAIQVDGDVSRNSVASLRANALPRLKGSFLSMNLKDGRAAFEAVPWVRHAQLQRIWPMRLRVNLEEHRAAAYWEARADGADSATEASAERVLVNSFGEVFQANLGDVEDEDLPVLAGPANAAGPMLQMWRALQPAAEKLGETIDRLDLSGRGSWRATFGSGAVIELGRGSLPEVAERFGQFARSITQVTAQYRSPLLSADLRHADGYAVRLRGVTTQIPGKPVNRKR